MKGNHTKYLAECTTFRLGGLCRNFLSCKTERELLEAIRKNEKSILIGGGSNILVSDDGYEGTILQFINPDPDILCKGNTVIVSGATLLDDLATYLVKEGLDMKGCIHGIPGTVGGAIAGNAGSWGKQIGDFVLEVKLLDHTGYLRSVSKKELDFSYRSSRMLESREIVVSATLQLQEASSDSLTKNRKDILQKRAKKHPAPSARTCGSVFKNVVADSDAGLRYPAARFLEGAGVFNLRMGGARVFPKHANMIIAEDGCSAQDVFDLHLCMQNLVSDKFGFDLQREMKCLGAFKGIDRHYEFFF